MHDNHLTPSILHIYRDTMETATILEQLEQVRLDIVKAKADLERAQARGKEELELEVRRTLNLLLEKEKTLTNALTSSGKY